MNQADKSLILLVEDNQDDLDLCLYAMKKHNLANRIEICRDGEQALKYLHDKEKIASKLPDLILLDLKLPKIGGLQVLEQIRSEPLTAHIPVVILTSSGEGPDIENSYKLGANSFIEKPVDFADFIDVVGKLGFYWLAINTSPG